MTKLDSACKEQEKEVGKLKTLLREKALAIESLQAANRSKEAQLESLRQKSMEEPADNRGNLNSGRAAAHASSSFGFASSAFKDNLLKARLTTEYTDASTSHNPGHRSQRSVKQKKAMMNLVIKNEGPAECRDGSLSNRIHTASSL